MPRFTARAALVAALLAHAPVPALGSVAEGWYLARGRANMSIHNYSAAIEAYENALRVNPASREASKDLALAYERNGETDKAVAQRDRYLARYQDDPDVAFAQARVLGWSRYAYRRGDALRYMRMGLARRDDPDRRRDLARLLAADRATLPEAVAEYRRVLAARPGDRASRGEYLKLLLWDPGYRDEAIGVLERCASEDPGDEQAQRDLARLLADDPRRAGEAADRLAPLVARHPSDPELRLTRARALVRAGRREAAREEYEQVLALRPVSEARLEYADLLASDPARRDQARAEYQRVLRADPRSLRARLGYARVLAARRETSREAVAQYGAVVERAPRDAEAHRGLARAYAWNGDADRALAHGALAERYGPPRADVEALERDLRTGREPALGGGMRLFGQPAGSWHLAGLGVLAAGSAEPTPFTSSSVEAGVATLRAPGAFARGPFALVRGQVRPDPDLHVDVEAGWDGIRTGTTALSGALRVARGTGETGFSLAIARRERIDSFRAAAGERVSGEPVGAASENAVEAALHGPIGPLQAEVSLRAGTITALAEPGDAFAELEARAFAPWVRAEGWTLSAGWDATFSTAARDLSGLGSGADPRAPGVFTPPFFTSQSPRLRLVRDDGVRFRLAAEAGPALQVVGDRGAALRAGGLIRAELAQRVGQHFQWSAEVRAEKIADVYARVSGVVRAAMLF